MAVFNKFQDFVEQLGKGNHSLSTTAAGGDVVKVYLTNATPSASADAVKGDLAEITAQNGYPSGGTSISSSFTESGGISRLHGQDVVFTASGGSFGPCRYAVLYNASSSYLMGWWDYGSSILVNDLESLTVDFGTTILTFE